jgi:hypothetical protein
MRRLALSLTALAALACGRTADSTDSANAVHSGAPPAEAPTAKASTRPAELTAADVEAFERGLARESEAVRAAQARASAATTPAERGAAAQAGWETATMPEGAKAAGMSPERYREVRATMFEVLRTLDFQGKIEGPMSIDTTTASPEMRQRAMRDPFAELTPATADAIRGRLSSLAPVWAEYINLTGVAG